MQRTMLDSNKTTEEQVAIKLMQIIENAVCSDYFIYWHFYKPTIWLLCIL
jgi:hypothetical protein